MDENKNQTPQLLSAKALGERLSLSKRVAEGGQSSVGRRVERREECPPSQEWGQGNPQQSAKQRADKCCGLTGEEATQSAAVYSNRFLGAARNDAGRSRGDDRCKIIVTTVCEQSDMVVLTDRLKNEVGELLLYLQGPLSPGERERCWHLLEAKLRQYVALKYEGLWP
jgi:hypothetical protein